MIACHRSWHVWKGASFALEVATAPSGHLLISRRDPRFCSAAVCPHPRVEQHGSEMALPPPPPIRNCATSYWAECDKIGRARGVWKTPWHPVYVHVTDDPERDWALIGPHIVDETNMFQQWNDEAASEATGKTVRTERMTDWAPIRASNYYAVVTPDELITMLNEQPDGAATIACKPLRIAPLVDMGWSSLELIVDKVLPNFRLVEPAPIAVPIPLLAEDMV